MFKAAWNPVNAITLGFARLTAGYTASTPAPANPIDLDRVVDDNSCLKSSKYQIVQIPLQEEDWKIKFDETIPHYKVRKTYWAHEENTDLILSKG